MLLLVSATEIAAKFKSESTKRDSCAQAMVELHTKKESKMVLMKGPGMGENMIFKINLLFSLGLKFLKMKISSSYCKFANSIVRRIH